MNQVTLDTLSVGTRAKIVRINAEKTVRRRMLDMGMVRGEIITIKSVAPLGDPVELLVKGYQLSLRKQEAKQIIVEIQKV
jgi:ferrous iron transport protein A